jgi:hypothetical protein
MRTIKELSESLLREYLSYDESSGVFVWKKGKCKDKKAGSVNANGYLQIMLGGRIYYAHRLAFLYVHGAFTSNCIDHINGIKTDNRISNLREATYAENAQNTRAYKNNKTGYRGVSFSKRDSKFIAFIRTNNKAINLGSFDLPSDAHNAYKNAKVHLHTFNPSIRDE